MNLKQIEEGARLILKGLEVDLGDHNFSKTPARVAKVYNEMFNPPDTGWPVFEEDYTDIVLMHGYHFYTMCPHHLLPVEIEAAVAYIPNGQVLGASKLIRICNDVNRCPMTQEKLTASILDRFDELTKHTSKGAGVILKGIHGCMVCRGVRARGASMTTCKFSGVLVEDLDQQRLFMELTKR